MTNEEGSRMTIQEAFELLMQFKYPKIETNFEQIVHL